jgi:hypothetical protein
MERVYNKAPLWKANGFVYLVLLRWLRFNCLGNSSFASFSSAMLWSGAQGVVYVILPVEAHELL